MSNKKSKCLVDLCQEQYQANDIKKRCVSNRKEICKVQNGSQLKHADVLLSKKKLCPPKQSYASAFFCDSSGNQNCPEEEDKKLLRNRTKHPAALLRKKHSKCKQPAMFEISESQKNIIKKNNCVNILLDKKKLENPDLELELKVPENLANKGNIMINVVVTDADGHINTKQFPKTGHSNRNHCQMEMQNQNGKEQAQKISLNFFQNDDKVGGNSEQTTDMDKAISTDSDQGGRYSQKKGGLLSLKNKQEQDQESSDLRYKLNAWNDTVADTMKMLEGIKNACISENEECSVPPLTSEEEIFQKNPKKCEKKKKKDKCKNEKQLIKPKMKRKMFKKQKCSKKREGSSKKQNQFEREQWSSSQNDAEESIVEDDLKDQSQQSSKTERQYLSGKLWKYQQDELNALKQAQWKKQNQETYFFQNNSMEEQPQKKKNQEFEYKLKPKQQSKPKQQEEDVIISVIDTGLDLQTLLDKGTRKDDSPTQTHFEKIQMMVNNELSAPNYRNHSDKNGKKPKFTSPIEQKLDMLSIICNEKRRRPKKVKEY